MQAFYDCTSQDVNPGGARKVFHGGRDNTDLGLGEGSAGNLLLGSALSIVVYPAPDKASLKVFEPLPRQTGNRKVHRRPHSLWGQVGKTGHEEQPLDDGVHACAMLSRIDRRSWGDEDLGAEAPLGYRPGRATPEDAARPCSMP